MTTFMSTLQKELLFVMPEECIKEKLPTIITPQSDGSKSVKRKLLSPGFSLTHHHEDDVLISEKHLTGTPKRKRLGLDSPPGAGIGLSGATPKTPGSIARLTPGYQVPLSERQQLAMIMRMTDETSQGAAIPPPEFSPKPTLPPAFQSMKRTPRNKRNERGETPLHIAAIKGDLKMTKRLIKAGADVNEQDFAGWTALHEACNHGWLHIAKHLLRAGANVNVQGLDNDTPLHDASGNGHQKLVELLVKHGANPTQPNSKGKTSMDLAASADISRLLRKEIISSSSDSSSFDDVRSPTSPESTSSTTKDDDRQLDLDDSDVQSPTHISGSKADLYGLPSSMIATNSLMKRSAPRSPENKTSSSPRLFLKFQHIKKDDPESDSSDKSKDSKDPLYKSYSVTLETGDRKSLCTSPSISAISPSSNDSDLYDPLLAPEKNKSPNNVDDIRGFSETKSSFQVSSSSESERVFDQITGMMPSDRNKDSNKSLTSCASDTKPLMSHLSLGFTPHLDPELGSSVNQRAAKRLKLSSKETGQPHIPVGHHERLSPEPAPQTAILQARVPILFSQTNDSYNRLINSYPEGSSSQHVLTQSSSSDLRATNSLPYSQNNLSLNRATPISYSQSSSSSSSRTSSSPFSQTVLSHNNNNNRVSNLQSLCTSSIPPRPHCSSYLSHNNQLYPHVAAPYSQYTTTTSSSTSHSPGMASLNKTLTGHSPSLSSHNPNLTGHNPSMASHSPSITTGHTPNRTSHTPGMSSHTPSIASYTPNITSHMPSIASHTPSSSTSLNNNVIVPTNMRVQSTPSSSYYLPQSTVIPCISSSNNLIDSTEERTRRHHSFSCNSTSASRKNSNEESPAKNSMPVESTTMDVSYMSKWELCSTNVTSSSLKSTSSMSSLEMPSQSLSEQARTSPNLDAIDVANNLPGTKDTNLLKSVKLDKDSKLSASTSLLSSSSSAPKVPPLKIIIPPKSNSASYSEADSVKTHSSKAALPYVVNSQQVDSRTGTPPLPQTLPIPTSVLPSQLSQSPSIENSRASSPASSRPSSRASSVVSEKGRLNLEHVNNGSAISQDNKCSSSSSSYNITKSLVSTSCTLVNPVLDSNNKVSTSSSADSSMNKYATAYLNNRDVNDIDNNSISIKQPDSEVPELPPRESQRLKERDKDRDSDSRDGLLKDANTTIKDSDRDSNSGASSHSKDAEKDGKLDEAQERRITRSLRSHTAQLHAQQQQENQQQQQQHQQQQQQEKTEVSSSADDAVLAMPGQKTLRVDEADDMNMHPRKRKLRPKTEAQTQECVQQASPLEKPPNPYELYLEIRKQVASRLSSLAVVEPKIPENYKDYLMVSCGYVLHGKSNSTLAVPMLSPPNSVTGQMRELFLEQENIRYKLRLQHLVEREKLILAKEQEILRVHGQAARAMANQNLIFSVCTILRDEEIYNPVDLEQFEEREKRVRSRFNGRQFLSWMQDVGDKYEKIKELLLLRHHHEAESLYAVQKMDWEWKMKEVGLCDYNITPIVDEVQVPMVQVSDEFELITA